MTTPNPEPKREYPLDEAQGFTWAQMTGATEAPQRTTPPITPRTKREDEK